MLKLVRLGQPAAAYGRLCAAKELLLASAMSQANRHQVAPVCLRDALGAKIDSSSMSITKSEVGQADAMAGDSLDERWDERGLPRELLARARALGISDSQLSRILVWNATPQQRVQEEIDWTDQLRNGSMRFRQLTIADDDAFRQLWANAPEAIGDWDVTVERGPNAFAQFELQERPVLNGLFDGSTMVACVSFAIRRTVVAGQDLVVHYGQAMRVHNDYRGRQYAHWVRSLPWAIGVGRSTHLQYDYIRSGNMAMESWNRKFMPKVESVPVREHEVPGLPVTVLQYSARHSAGETVGARKARLDDLERCVGLINETHSGRDLFRPYTLPSFSDRLDAGLADGLRSPITRPYSLDDFYVLERDGEILACAGLWDRGRDLWEHWRHRESGDERKIAVTALLDYGVASEHEDQLAALIVHLIGVTHDLGRDFLVAPLESMPAVASTLEDYSPDRDTRYLQWRGDKPTLTAPAYLDLVYW